MSTFVSKWLAAEVNKYHDRFGIPETKKEIIKQNRHFYKKYPEMAKRTLRTATKAVRDGDFKTDLTNNHYVAMPVDSIVPDRFSDEEKYIELMKDIIAKCKKDGTRIRLANVQDLHLENVEETAILNLLFQVLQDFDPHYVPVLADLVDNKLLQSVVHGQSISEYENLYDGDPQTYFEEATCWYLDSLNEVAPNAIKPSWLGNHEWWLLRFFVKTGMNPTYFLNNFMEKFKARGGLWLCGDKKTEVHITDNVMGVHGWLARTSNYGSTANGYKKHYGNYKSIFAGHSHRPETVWTRPHPDTQGRNFVNITGTLGSIRPAYQKGRYVGHVQQFNLARLAPTGNLGHEIIEVPIHYDPTKEIYFCYVEGKRYEEEATHEPTWLNPFREE